MTYLRTPPRKVSVTIKAHYRLSDGFKQITIFGNTHKTRRERMVRTRTTAGARTSP